MLTALTFSKNLLELLSTYKVTNKILFEHFFLQEDYLMIPQICLRRASPSPDFAVKWFSLLSPRNRFSHHYVRYFYSR
uniref:Uncharacterized protein n=1 Tax=Accipiter nisus TaxID=211598 RepID=A0A8B9MEK0_9AVES